MVRFTRFIGAAAIRRAARGPCAPRARRPFSSPPSPPSSFNESELRLYARIAEVEAFGNDRANALRKEYAELREKHNKVLKLFGESTTQARDAVRVTAGVSVLFVAGLVTVGLAGLHVTRPKGPSASTESAAAAAAAAKAAAAAAETSAATHASLAVLGKRPAQKEKDDPKKEA